MTHWQQKARNKAMGDKAKAKRQGAQVVEFIRRINGADGKGKDSFSPNGRVETAPTGDGQAGGEQVSALRDQENG